MPTGVYARPTLEERLWAKVSKDGEDGCWVWNGSKNEFGHGSIVMNVDGVKRLVRTHRVAWEMTRGPIPTGKCVLHRCDNPPCCNPAHLFLGTKADNTADMIAKKRHAYGFALPHTKISFRTIRAVRLATGSQSEIARRFGLSQSYVCQIRNQQSRKLG